MRMLLTWLLVLTVKADPFYRDQRPRPGLQFRSRKFVWGKLVVFGSWSSQFVDLEFVGNVQSYKKDFPKENERKRVFSSTKHTLQFSPSTHGGDSTFSPNRVACRNDFYAFHSGDCVTVVNGCGEFGAKTSNLTIIGTNFDGECLVARVGQSTHASCTGYQLAIESDTTCGNVGAVAKLDERNLVLGVCLLLHVGLGVFLCYVVDSGFLQGLLFWWSDFFAGLFWNLMAVAIWTSGIDDPVRSFVVGLACGLVFEEVFYDLPLKIFKNCTGTLCWIRAVWILGCFYLLFGINAAYMADTVALVGHHAILYGIAQWIVDILKAVVMKHLCDFVCQRPQKETYRVLITELGDPLPKQRENQEDSEDSEGSEDPNGKV